MIKREQDLIDAGWEKRFIACEPRLSEMVDMYREIGFEVHLEPLPTKEELEGDACGVCEEKACTVCYEAETQKYRTIFTKKMGDR